MHRRSQTMRIICAAWTSILQNGVTNRLGIAVHKGKALTWVSGYQPDVDWTLSLEFDMIPLRKMFDLDEIEKATKHARKYADRFAKALGDSQKISRSMK